MLFSYRAQEWHYILLALDLVWAIKNTTKEMKDTATHHREVRFHGNLSIADIRIKNKNKNIKEKKNNEENRQAHYSNARPSKCSTREALSGTTLTRTSTTATRNRLTCYATSCFAWHPRASRFRCPFSPRTHFEGGLKYFQTRFFCWFIYPSALINFSLFNLLF